MTPEALARIEELSERRRAAVAGIDGLLEERRAINRQIDALVEIRERLTAEINGTREEAIAGGADAARIGPPIGERPREASLLFYQPGRPRCRVVVAPGRCEEARALVRDFDAGPPRPARAEALSGIMRRRAERRAAGDASPWHAQC